MSSKVVEVKKEPCDNLELENRILVLLASNPDGIVAQAILDDMPQSEPRAVVESLNRLLKKHPIGIAKKSNGDLLYKLQASKSVTAKNAKGEGHEEKLVYQIIEEAGNTGIWNKHIQDKSKIVIKQLDKILKNLETKKLIKRVTSVSAAKRKIYMLYDLTPDSSLTGGTWYSDQRFDSEYVEAINQCCLGILEKKSKALQETRIDPMAQRNASFMASSDILQALTELNVSKVTLSLSDIEMILQTLIFDDKVEKLVATNSAGVQTNLYRAVSPIIKSTGLVRMPCGLCPLILECHDGGAISPAKCVYMNNWLDF